MMVPCNIYQSYETDFARVFSDMVTGLPLSFLLGSSQFLDVLIHQMIFFFVADIQNMNTRDSCARVGYLFISDKTSI